MRQTIWRSVLGHLDEYKYGYYTSITIFALIIGGLFFFTKPQFEPGPIGKIIITLFGFMILAVGWYVQRQVSIEKSTA